jgi:hypothetical protein
MKIIEHCLSREKSRPGFEKKFDKNIETMTMLDPTTNLQEIHRMKKCAI